MVTYNHGGWINGGYTGSDSTTVRFETGEFIYRNWVSTTSSSWRVTNIAWESWVNNIFTTGTTAQTVTVRPDPYADSPTYEQVQTWRREEQAGQARYARLAAAEAEQKRAAREKAREWLKSLLTWEQWQEWLAAERFTLVCESGNRYEIRNGIAGNVKRLDETGHVVESLCCHPDTTERNERGEYLGTLPKEDVVVAQLLALQHDEEGFRRTANITHHAPAYAEA